MITPTRKAKKQKQKKMKKAEDSGTKNKNMNSKIWFEHLPTIKENKTTYS